MAKTAHTIDQVRRDAAKAMIDALNDNHDFADITIDMLAEKTKHDAKIIHRLFPNTIQIIDQGLRDLDDEIMTQFASDLAHDLDSNIRERILEGLMVRFEGCNPYKSAIKNLNKAAILNPPLANTLINRLSAASKTILELAGDDTAGATGILRIKGLAAVALAVQPDWLKDDTPDLSVTMRKLDQRFKQAESLAEMFGIIPHKKTGEQNGGQTSEQNTETPQGDDSHDH